MAKYTEEQYEALGQLYSAWAYAEGMYEALKYMEERLGKVNTHVIDFRKRCNVVASERIRRAQFDFEQTGSLDAILEELVKNIDLKSDGKD